MNIIDEAKDLLTDLEGRIKPNYQDIEGTESHERNQCANAVRSLLSEIERLNSCLKYEQHRLERIGTHGEGCEAWGHSHYECALREIEELNKDKARVDWLADVDNMVANLLLPTKCVMDNLSSMRHAIDDAMILDAAMRSGNDNFQL